MSSSQRHWCFTHFDTEWAGSFVFDEKHVRYMIVGVEMCHSTKRWHYQGYAEFNEKITRKTAMMHLRMPGAHFEQRYGSRESAREYCMETKERHEAGECYNEKKCIEKMEKESRIERWKTYSYKEFGAWERGGSGKRNDIADIRSDVKAGKSKLEIMDTRDASWRLGRSLDEYKLLSDSKAMMEEGFKKKDTRVYWGHDSGCGKTRRAIYECLPADDTYILTQSSTGTWWDGYMGQKHVIIDEFKGWIPYSTLLRILDGYPCQVDIKGGRRMLGATIIIITSNYPPEEWYPTIEMQNGLGPLMRRLNKIEHMEFLDRIVTKIPPKVCPTSGRIIKEGFEIASGRSWEPPPAPIKSRLRIIPEKIVQAGGSPASPLRTPPESTERPTAPKETDQVRSLLDKQVSEALGLREVNRTTGAFIE